MGNDKLIREARGFIADAVEALEETSELSYQEELVVAKVHDELIQLEQMLKNRKREKVEDPRHECSFFFQKTLE